MGYTPVRRGLNIVLQFSHDDCGLFLRHMIEQISRTNNSYHGVSHNTINTVDEMFAVRINYQFRCYGVNDSRTAVGDLTLAANGCGNELGTELSASAVVFR